MNRAKNSKTAAKERLLQRKKEAKIAKEVGLQVYDEAAVAAARLTQQWEARVRSLSQLLALLITMVHAATLHSRLPAMKCWKQNYNNDLVARLIPIGDPEDPFEDALDEELETFTSLLQDSPVGDEPSLLWAAVEQVACEGQSQPQFAARNKGGEYYPAEDESTPGEMPEKAHKVLFRELKQELADGQWEILTLRQELASRGEGKFEISLHPIILQQIEKDLANYPPPRGTRAVVSIGVDGVPSVAYVPVDVSDKRKEAPAPEVWESFPPLETAAQQGIDPAHADELDAMREELVRRARQANARVRGSAM